MADAPTRNWPIQSEAAFDDVRLSRASALARWSVRTRSSTDLPAAILTAARWRETEALKLGPDEWLFLAPEGSTVPALPAPCSIVDVSDRSIAFLADGPRAGALLQTGCPIDLGPAFAVGRATRTVFEQIEIILWRTADRRWHVEVWRSFAEYLWCALVCAAGD